ncbi:MAG: cupredoxin family copper-binding protein [Acidimicrobiia bacterium]|nr:cupredoxin family copper-binding protein [Acidimicrobiia bacterium]
MRRKLGVLLSALTAAALIAIPAADAASGSVSIQNFSFQPHDVTVNVGDTVTWTMRDANTQHTVTADDNSFSSSALSVGQTFSHTFSQAGTFTYHCNIHPSMTGSVTVQGAAPPATQPPATQPPATSPPSQPAATAPPATAAPRPAAAPTTAAPTTTTVAPSTTTTIAPPAAADGTTSSTTAAVGGGVALPAQKTSSGGGGSGVSGWLIALAVILVGGAATGGVLLRRRTTPG